MNKKDVMYVVIAFMMSVCSVSIVMADALDRVREMKNGTLLYVYNDETKLWDRARKEDLKNAMCDKLHTYVME